MAALKRVSACFCFLRRSASVLFNRNPAVQKLGKWTNLLNISAVSLAVGAGLCAVPFTQVENLSHDSLVRRAASLVTNSSSTFLSQTTLALIDAFTAYAKAVHTLIALQRRYLASLGKLTSAEEDSIWQVIIGQRAEVSDRQDECKRFESTWESAVRLCEMAAEASYTSGAEQASITVRTNIQVAQSQVEEVRKLLVDANKKLAETKVMEIQRMAEYASSLEKNKDDEDIPEAYLRED
ncbi:diablo homolog, mitochondrial-like isoform X2 [Thalassophryne amazonica]|uniref:diablo homolog, mitochondrial-like isoform X1 n=1 Tax=Thalassophryne amazonica TaxID=390379 RepID=UPI0014718335|nr:diablo homolog, mitochondrial-like isoform X1 [Thalassophryne amazonica]XP_034024244.1 diablo homolog, mitochondrial-like isoform X2 [Thalassophryne amazonica]